MADRRSVDDLSTEELERLLTIRKREKRLRRLRRMRADGRLVNLAPLERTPAPRPREELAGGTTSDGPELPEGDLSWTARLAGRVRLLPSLEWFRDLNLRRLGNRFLLLVELGALAGLMWILWDTWQTRQELNREVSQVHQEIIEESFPTPAPTPLIGVVLLPGGHTSPIEPGGARQGEAGSIPEHLLPLVAAYKPPPLPTPGPEQARRIAISAIGVDHPIVEGDDWEQLRKGVGHHIGSADPGQAGNMVLTAHNDIYGEIFRHLEELEPGDEIIVYTLTRKYLYRVQSQRMVEPFEVKVMAPTRKPTVTLISCHPYLVDTQRIVVIGALEEEL
jgi:sortase A